MGENKYSNPLFLNGIEGWMKQFFSSSFSTLHDEFDFSVDLFETSQDYIVEAELEGVKIDEINLLIEKESLYICILYRVNNQFHKEQLERMITFPFSLENREINAIFENGILEIKISKLEACHRNGCHIPIHIEKG